MDYKAAFAKAVDQVRDEGRYRVFADLKRHRGDFPMATWTSPDGAERDVHRLVLRREWNDRGDPAGRHVAVEEGGEYVHHEKDDGDHRDGTV